MIDVSICVRTILWVMLVSVAVLAACSGDDSAAEDKSTTTSGEMISTTVPLETHVDGIIRLPTDRFPTAAAFFDDRFWLIAEESAPEEGVPPAKSAVLLGVDAASGLIEVEVALSDGPARLIADEAAVWVHQWETGAVSRRDPETGELVANVELELPFNLGGPDGRVFVPSDMALGHGSVWVSTARGALARIDRESNRVDDIYEFEGRSLAGDIAVGPGGVWVTGLAGGLFHVSAATGEITDIPLEVLDHAAESVFVPGGEIGDTVYVMGDRLQRDADGTFRIADGGYLTSGQFGVSRVDPETLEVRGSTSFEAPIVYLGWLNAFVGALDNSGVFTHLSTIPRLGSQVNTTSWSGGYVVTALREAWEIDTAGNRLVRVDETGSAAISLPFEIEDGSERRPIWDEVEISEDWIVLDPGPLEPRWPAVAAWTGEEIVIWGGETIGGSQPVEGGAAYSPSTDTWRSMSEAPLTVAREPGWVWTGEELVIWTHQHAAAWNPDGNVWRDIQLWPLGGSFYRRAVWTGDVIIDVAAGQAVDPTTGDSNPIAEPPRLHERASAAWVDGHVVLVTGEGAYTVEDDAWRLMPDSGLTPLATSGASLGDELFAADYEMHASRYDPVANVWTSYPDLPLRFSECAPDAHVFGGQPLAQHCSGLAAWAPDDGHWIPIAQPKPVPVTQPAIITAGDQLFVWGDGFYEFVGDIEQPVRLAVGISFFDRPEDWTITSVSGESSGGTVEVRVDAAGGDSCTITAIHAGAEAVLQSYLTDPPGVAELTPHVGGDSIEALVVSVGKIDDRHHLVWAAGTTDVIDLACNSADAANRLAPRIWAPYQ